MLVQNFRQAEAPQRRQYQEGKSIIPDTFSPYHTTDRPPGQVSDVKMVPEKDHEGNVSKMMWTIKLQDTGYHMQSLSVQDAEEWVARLNDLIGRIQNTTNK